jgi:arabinofuranosyltransferase
MRKLKFLSIFIYTVFLTLISLYINGKSLIGIDDANIYMVYMKNFANGYGFVYNVGGERVEGFTSLLWTLIGSFFFYLSSKPEILLLSANLLIITYTLYIITCYLDKFENNKFLSVKSFIFLGIIGITPGFIDWTITSLMETGLWCFLLTTTSLKILSYKKIEDKYKHYSVLNLLYILLVITRPESMLLVPFFVLLNSLKEYFVSKTIRVVITTSFISLLVFISSLVILLYWRLEYFGYPLPNTYYAKVSSSKIDNMISGLRYLYSLFIQKPLLLVLISFSFWKIIKAIIYKNIIANFSFFILFSIMMVSLAIPLYSGGDHFGLHRFIMPFIPIFFLSGIVILKELNFFASRTKLMLLFFLFFFSNEYNYKNWYIHKMYPISHEWGIAVGGRSDSEKLNDFFRANRKLPSQGVLVAGGTAYGYNGETIDLLGLNNTKMAHADKIKDRNLPKNHASFNSDVFFQLCPDLFWYSNCGFVKYSELVPIKNKVNANTFSSTVFKNIQLDDRFIESYGYYRIENVYNQKEALLIFANKKFVRSLDTFNYKITTIPYE